MPCLNTNLTPKLWTWLQKWILSHLLLVYEASPLTTVFDKIMTQIRKIASWFHLFVSKGFLGASNFAQEGENRGVMMAAL